MFTQFKHLTWKASLLAVIVNLLAFTIALVRYNTDGSLDTTFNATGKKVFSVFPGVDSGARDVIVQSDRKIVIIGFIGTGPMKHFALVRLNSGGSFDTTFSGDRKITVDFGGEAYGQSLALQPSDGKYVLAGYRYDNTGTSDFALARVLP